MSTIKRCFHSRHPDGFLIEVDYSQLEVIVLAHLTRDPTLTSDILSGMDMHTVRAAELFNVPEKDVTKEMRTFTKTFSFQLQYGSGPKNMAETTGASIDLAKQFIANYYARYPMVKQWQDDRIEEVKKNACPILKNTPSCLQVYEGHYTSETGRRYVFETYDPPAWMRNPSPLQFSPTQIKNYMIQGTATGDIVPMMLGELYSAIKNWEGHHGVKNQILMINTVHDSILLDVPQKHLIDAINLIEEVLKNTTNFYFETFKKRFNLPLRFEIEVGKNWEDMVSVNKIKEKVDSVV